MSDDLRPKVAPVVSLLDDIGYSRRRRARRNLIIIGLVIFFGGAGFWYFEHTLSLHVVDVASFGISLENSIATTIADNISAPPPLRATSTIKRAASTASKTSAPALTRTGVIADTNAARSENGDLPPLAENATLDSVATLRLDDMFDKQYFAHIAPDGSSATSTAQTVGYAYLFLGENLALGNFANDQDIVNAWMASPGHRENILNAHYTEIGVAVKKGTYQGSNVWIGVQVFGKPASSCPSPDGTLKANIATAENNLSAMQAELQDRKAAIDAMQPKSGPDYNQAVASYNALADQYNSLGAQTKAAIDQYNAEVNTFNSCLGS